MEDKNICLRCGHLSSEVFENESVDIDDWNRVQCPECFSPNYYIASLSDQKLVNAIKKRTKKPINMMKELEWWKLYGEYVSRVYSGVDAEACGYADGDIEYKENFNQNADQL